MTKSGKILPNVVSTIDFYFQFNLHTVYCKSSTKPLSLRSPHFWSKKFIKPLPPLLPFNSAKTINNRQHYQCNFTPSIWVQIYTQYSSSIFCFFEKAIYVQPLLWPQKFLFMYISEDDSEIELKHCSSCSSCYKLSQECLMHLSSIKACLQDSIQQNLGFTTTPFARQKWS